MREHVKSTPFSEGRIGHLTRWLGHISAAELRDQDLEFLARYPNATHKFVHWLHQAYPELLCTPPKVQMAAVREAFGDNFTDDQYVEALNCVPNYNARGGELVVLVPYLGGSADTFRMLWEMAEEDFNLPELSGAAQTWFDIAVEKLSTTHGADELGLCWEVFRRRNGASINEVSERSGLTSPCGMLALMLLHPAFIDVRANTSGSALWLPGLVHGGSGLIMRVGKDGSRAQLTPVAHELEFQHAPTGLHAEATRAEVLSVTTRVVADGQSMGFESL